MISKLLKRRFVMECSPMRDQKLAAYKAMLSYHMHPSCGRDDLSMFRMQTELRDEQYRDPIHALKKTVSYNALPAGLG